MQKTEEKMPRKAKEEMIKKEQTSATKVAKRAKTTTNKTSKATKVAKTTKTPKKATTKKRTATKSDTLKNEYYDLPTSYNQTVVKILAQTPKILFVYWDISEKDKEKLMKKYGDNFFQETSPFLLITNKTQNYSFEIEVNDYANSWYLSIPDSDCKYEVTLIRRMKNRLPFVPLDEPQSNSSANQSYVAISCSETLETPNDHILFEKLGKTIFLQDVKSHKVEEKNIASFTFMQNIGEIYNIYDFYKQIYQDELKENVLNTPLSSS